MISRCAQAKPNAAIAVNGRDLAHDQVRAIGDTEFKSTKIKHLESVVDDRQGLIDAGATSK